MPTKKKAQKTHSLVIVESPTKAKTIAKFLGRDFTVLSSFGHVRDLPKKDLGVDVDHDFAPRYVVPMKSKKIVTELKKEAKKADMVYFASDEDREGEAISWHLLELLDLPQDKIKRITFHEITDKAIKHAVEHPRELDMRLVDAQQARRVLDRLVGYKLSPFLWHKVARGLSAGRVQSIIVRLLVEREREIQKFVAQEYWSVEAMLAKKGSEAFLSKLTKKDGEALDKFAIPAGPEAEKIVADLEAAKWTVAAVEKKTVHRSPSPPFTTSTLQQEGNNRLGYSAKQTMMLAQQLYEGMDVGDHGTTGLITYMRTDSVNLAESFIEEAREWIGKNAGAGALPGEARKYKTKSKGAQEAHEAIRPTSVLRTPDSIASHLDDRQLKLYTLIWQRAVASQMIDAELLTVGVNIDATKSGAPTYGFRATGSTIVKKGFLEIYETDTKETHLPVLAEGDALDAQSVEPKQHFTEPPPRYTEASLVKTLEENGIGRPSTYAPTISTVIDRGYVQKDGRKLQPLELAFRVNDMLVEHFPDIVDTGFTAKMEEDLDAVAEGEAKWQKVIGEFYEPFAKTLATKEKDVKKEVVETNIVCEKCGKPMALKYGRFGQFLACTGFPECRNTKQVKKTDDGHVEAEEEPVIDEKCEKCGKPMMMKRGRFGPFLSCSGYPECKTIKSIEKKVGVKCPVCKEGDIIEKRSKRGKPFYACNRYPDCKTAFWSKPTGEECPTCGKLLVYAKGDTVRCSDKECDFEKPAPMKTEPIDG